MNAQIYTVIKNRILFLEYAPGQILNENVLAKEFGVSRTPMRDVLNRLEWEKMARVIPRTGTMVTEIKFEHMMNIYRARFEIEGLAGSLAVEHISKAHLEDLFAVKKRCEALLKNNDRDKDKRNLVEIDKDFREIVYDAIRNPVVAELCQSLYEQTFRLWFITLANCDWPLEVKALVDEITSCHEAFSKKDSKMSFGIKKKYLINHFDRIKTKFLGS
ncbi:HTH-type transcriptional regulator [Desulforapulum autotrophicum HRM2]|jgi:DNA-binding GntR family transcriptional regulator|uniref:HTH-type transcriptional regulator n=1 Tax=Desulforapulum autotrophicum (strain ATCC 43914 / DSM 3382 / VKM B-1955 / HRM2) TaxID=177437 RepID=C0QAV8_DESAH|nr:GntR family transcriptional regulator [Desulforapulum autotrophicum]ACN16891.1 HTH-type transcriptional regulator [Desulforapulum autotrophicum HRM2]